MDEIVVDAGEIYEDLPTFEWEKYQRGFLGILNNAYNQSCNCGTKVLGDMSEISSDFDGGSYEDFLTYYRDEHNGEEKFVKAVTRMTDNLIDRVESVGGTLERDKAMEWSEKYIRSMLVNSYRGFAAEKEIISAVASEMNQAWMVAPPELESKGIDGCIGSTSVQVKPSTHSDLDINDHEADMLLTYDYDEDSNEFTISVKDGSN